MAFIEKHFNTLLIAAGVIFVAYVVKSELDKSKLSVGFNQ